MAQRREFLTPIHDAEEPPSTKPPAGLTTPAPQTPYNYYKGLYDRKYRPAPRKINVFVGTMNESKRIEITAPHNLARIVQERRDQPEGFKTPLPAHDLWDGFIELHEHEAPRYWWNDPKYLVDYWADPWKVSRFQHFIQAQPKDWQPPEWLDTNMVDQLYNYYKYKNEDEPWYAWKRLHETDPAMPFIKSLSAPPPEYLMPGVEVVKYTPTERELARYQQQTDPYGYQLPAGEDINWDQLPTWQKVTYDLFGAGTWQSGALMGAGTAAVGSLPFAVIGTIIAPGIGTIIGALAPLMLGAAAGAMLSPEVRATLEETESEMGLDAMEVLEWSMLALDWFAGGVEQATGVVTQLLGATLDPQRYGTVNEIMDNLYAARMAARITYHVAPIEVMNVAPFIQQVLTGEKMEYAQKGEAWHLGEEHPRPAPGGIDPLQLIADVRQEIVENPQNANEIIEYYIAEYGISGQVRLLLGYVLADPLNVVPTIERGIGWSGAKMVGKPRLAQAFTMGEPGIFGGIRNYRTMVRTGTAGSLSSLTAFDRTIGGLVRGGDDINRIKQLTKTPAGLKNYLFNMTSSSKAAAFGDITFENLAVALDNWGGNPETAASILEAWGKQDYDLLASYGATALDSPEAYTALPGLNDFIETALPEHVSKWQANQYGRDVLLETARVLEMQPAEILDHFVDAEGIETLFSRLERAAREKADPFYERIARGIENPHDPDGITAAGLEQIFTNFAENGDAWHPNMWLADLYEGMNVHVGEWAINYFNVKPENGVFRFGQMMKSAQSLLLLGFNPGYLINNSINNIVTRGAQGIFGYVSNRSIEAFFDRFGVEPVGLRRGIGAGELGTSDLPRVIETPPGEVATMRDIQRLGRAKRESALREAVRVDDRMQKVQEVIEATGDKVAIASKASAWMEKSESAQGYTAAMRQMWGKTWKPGAGFDHMPPALAESLSAIDPRLPDWMHSMIQASVNPREMMSNFEKGVFVRDVDGYIRQAADVVGMEPEQAKMMLGELYDEMQTQLREAKTKPEVEYVFRTIRRKMQDRLDQLQGLKLRNEIAHIIQKTEGEGLTFVLDSMNEGTTQLTEHWIEHNQKWDSVWEEYTEVLRDTGVKSDNMIRERMEESNREWFRTQTAVAAKYKGIVDGLGNTEGSVRIKTALIEQFSLWRDFHTEKNQLLKDYWNTPSEQRGSWMALQDQLNSMYLDAADLEVSAQLEIDNIFIERIGVHYGDEVSNQVTLWRDGLRDIRAEMVQSMVEVRGRVNRTVVRNAEGKVDMLATRTAKNKVWQEYKADYYLKRIVDLGQEQINGAVELFGRVTDQEVAPPAAVVEEHLRQYVQETTGEEPPAGRQPPPEEPPTPGRPEEPEPPTEPRAPEPPTRAPEEPGARPVAEEAAEISDALHSAGDVIDTEGNRHAIATFADDVLQVYTDRETGAVVEMPWDNIAEVQNNTGDTLWVKGDPESTHPQVTENVSNANAVRALGDEYDIATLTDRGTPNDRHLLNAVNKYLDLEGPDRYNRIADVPEDLARKALDIRKDAKQLEVEEFHKRAEQDIQLQEDRAVIEMTRDRLTEQMLDAGISHRDAQVISSLFEARAETWAQSTGNQREAFYTRYLQEVRRNPDLKGKKGSLTFDPESGKLIIELSKKADLSTMLHEFAHVSLFDYLERMRTGDTEIHSILEWLTGDKLITSAEVKARHRSFTEGTLKGKDLQAYKAQQERFSNAFERYVREGIAPTTGLQGLFNYIRSFMTNAYKKIRGSRLDVEMNSTVRGFFDDMLAGEAATPGSVADSYVPRAYNNMLRTMMDAAHSGDFDMAVDALTSAHRHGAITSSQMGDLTAFLRQTMDDYPGGNQEAMAKFHRDINAYEAQTREATINDIADAPAEEPPAAVDVNELTPPPPAEPPAPRPEPVEAPPADVADWQIRYDESASPDVINRKFDIFRASDAAPKDHPSYDHFAYLAEMLAYEEGGAIIKDDWQKLYNEFSQNMTPGYEERSYTQFLDELASRSLHKGGADDILWKKYGTALSNKINEVHTRYPIEVEIVETIQGKIESLKGLLETLDAAKQEAAEGNYALTTEQRIGLSPTATIIQAFKKAMAEKGRLDTIEGILATEIDPELNLHVRDLGANVAANKRVFDLTLEYDKAIKTRIRDLQKQIRELPELLKDRFVVLETTVPRKITRGWGETMHYEGETGVIDNYTYLTDGSAILLKGKLKNHRMKQIGNRMSLEAGVEQSVIDGLTVQALDASVEGTMLGTYEAARERHIPFITLFEDAEGNVTTIDGERLAFALDSLKGSKNITYKTSTINDGKMPVVLLMDGETMAGMIVGVTVGDFHAEMVKIAQGGGIPEHLRPGAPEPRPVAEPEALAPVQDQPTIQEPAPPPTEPTIKAVDLLGQGIAPRTGYSGQTRISDYFYVAVRTDKGTFDYQLRSKARRFTHPEEGFEKFDLFYLERDAPISGDVVDGSLWDAETGSMIVTDYVTKGQPDETRGQMRDRLLQDFTERLNDPQKLAENIDRISGRRKLSPRYEEAARAEQLQQHQNPAYPDKYNQAYVKTKEYVSELLNRSRQESGKDVDTVVIEDYHNVDGIDVDTRPILRELGAEKFIDPAEKINQAYYKLESRKKLHRVITPSQTENSSIIHLMRDDPTTHHTGFTKPQREYMIGKLEQVIRNQMDEAGSIQRYTEMADVGQLQSYSIQIPGDGMYTFDTPGQVVRMLYKLDRKPIHIHETFELDAFWRYSDVKKAPQPRGDKLKPITYPLGYLADDAMRAFGKTEAYTTVKNLLEQSEGLSQTQKGKYRKLLEELRKRGDDYYLPEEIGEFEKVAAVERGQLEKTLKQYHDADAQKTQKYFEKVYKAQEKVAEGIEYAPLDNEFFGYYDAEGQSVEKYALDPDSGFVLRDTGEARNVVIEYGVEGKKGTAEISRKTGAVTKITGEFSQRLTANEKRGIISSIQEPVNKANKFFDAVIGTERKSRTPLVRLRVRRGSTDLVSRPDIIPPPSMVETLREFGVLTLAPERYRADTGITEGNFEYFSGQKYLAGAEDVSIRAYLLSVAANIDAEVGGVTGDPYADAMQQFSAAIKRTVDEGGDLFNRPDADDYSLGQPDDDIINLTGAADESIHNDLVSDTGEPPAVGHVAPGVMDQNTPIPEADGLHDLWIDKLEPTIKEIERAALNDDGQMKTAYGDLAGDDLKAVERYLTTTQGQMNRNKLFSLRYAETQRDRALLNYRKKYGIDMVGQLAFPYEFWYTRTMLQWAARAMTKPAWFANWSRLRRMQRMIDENIPTRLKGKIQFSAPYLPEWSGQRVFNNPLRMIFPVEQMLEPWRRLSTQRNQEEKTAMFILERWAGEGDHSIASINQAMENRQGELWNKALDQARAQVKGEIQNPYDFIGTLIGPALWVSLPLNIIKGQPEKSSPLPITRTANAYETVLKGTPLETVGNIIGMMAKPEEFIRQKTGLSQFGEWGDYYIDRHLSNMVAEGLLSPKEAQQAMIERQGEAYQEAIKRVELEVALQTPTALTLYAFTHQGGGLDHKLLSIVPGGLFSGGLLPVGELKHRGKYDEYNAAMKAKYQDGDEDAIRNFFEENPEYEARLALFDKPEERLRQFMISEIWDQWYETPGIDKSRVTDALGEAFETYFLSSDTRDYANIDINTLAYWSQTIGGLVPDVEETEDITGMPLFEQKQIDYHDPELVKAVDTYYAERDERFPLYGALNDIYFGYAKGSQERRAFLKKFPLLKEGWDWNREYKAVHPELDPWFDELEAKHSEGQETPADQTKISLDVLQKFTPELISELYLHTMIGGDLGEGAYMELHDLWQELGNPEGSFENFIKYMVIPAFKTTD